MRIVQRRFTYPLARVLAQAPILVPTLVLALVVGVVAGVEGRVAVGSWRARGPATDEGVAGPVVAMKESVLGLVVVVVVPE